MTKIEKKDRRRPASARPAGSRVCICIYNIFLEFFGDISFHPLFECACALISAIYDICQVFGLEVVRSVRCVLCAIVRSTLGASSSFYFLLCSKVKHNFKFFKPFNQKPIIIQHNQIIIFKSYNLHLSAEERWIVPLYFVCAYSNYFPPPLAPFHQSEPTKWAKIPRIPVERETLRWCPFCDAVAVDQQPFAVGVLRTG